MTFGPSNTSTPFLPQNRSFSKDPEQFLIQITNLYADIARYLNAREIGGYQNIEQVSGQFFTDTTNAQQPKSGFRKVFPFSDANLNFAHNISNLTRTSYIGGSFTDGSNFYPLPFVTADAGADQVEIYLTSTNVVIVKGGFAPAITDGLVIVEYLRN